MSLFPKDNAWSNAYIHPKPSDTPPDDAPPEVLQAWADEELVGLRQPNGEDHAPPPDPPPHPEAEPAPSRVGRILTGDEFTTGYTPPVWLIDGLVQRSRLYACTSLTGHGKTAVWLFNACMVHAGRMIGNLEAYHGNVLILAGENPEDLKARMHGMMAAYRLQPAQLPYVLPGNFPMTPDEAEALLKEIEGLGVPLCLIIGDTSASFFPGEDDNDNKQQLLYAQTLRALTERAPGRPAVVVLSHPVKNARKDNLIPRGGGAFLNELDGNFTLWSDDRDTTALHWEGKIRGPDFAPVTFRLRQIPTGLIDEKERPEITIVAEPMGEEAAADHAKQVLADEDVILVAVRDHPGISQAQIAEDAGWVREDGRPYRQKVSRLFLKLAKDGLIKKARRKWMLTPAGERELEDN